MSYDYTVLDTAPLAYWPMSETSGTTAYDLAGSDRHGDYYSVTKGQSPLAPELSYSCAFSFSSVVLVPDAPWMRTPYLSVCGWAHRTDLSARIIAQRKSGSSNAWDFTTPGTTPNANGSVTTASGTTWTSATGFPINTTRFVTMTYDGTTAKIYFDAALANSFSNSGPILERVGVPFTIGNSYPTGPSPWTGRLSNFALWGRPLEDSEILAIYNAGLTPPPLGLLRTGSGLPLSIDLRIKGPDGRVRIVEAAS